LRFVRLRIPYPVAAALTAALAIGTVVPFMVAASVSGPAARATLPPGQTNSTRAPAAPVELPVAAGKRSATSDPSLIGSDPSLIHFGVDQGTLPDLDSLIWQTGGGRESVEAAYGSGASISLSLYRREGDAQQVSPYTRMQSTKQIAINGRPATLQKYGRVPGSPLPIWTIYWQPVPRVFAGVNAADATDVAIRAFAGSVRLATTYECVQPLKVGKPPGGRLIGCRTGLSGPGHGRPGLGAWWHSSLTYSGGVELSLRPYPTAPALVANTTAAGQPAQWDANAQTLRISPYHRVLDLTITGLPQDRAVALAEGLTVADLTNPGDWPPV
jgi:hypothetical protein